MLISASIALASTAKVEDYVDNFDGRLDLDTYAYSVRNLFGEPGDSEYGTFKASGTRGAAGWSVFISAASIIISSILMIVRCFMIKDSQTGAEKYYTLSTVVVSLHMN